MVDLFVWAAKVIFYAGAYGQNFSKCWLKHENKSYAQHLEVFEKVTKE